MRINRVAAASGFSGGDSPGETPLGLDEDSPIVPGLWRQIDRWVNEGGADVDTGSSAKNA